MQIGLQIERFDVSRGGAETYMVELARRMVEAGHEVSVFTASCPVQPIDTHIRLIKPFTPRTAARAVRQAGLDVVLGTGQCLGMNVFQPHGGTVLGTRRQNLSFSGNAPARAFRTLFEKFNPKRRAAAAFERAQYAQTDPLPRFIAISRMVRADMQYFYGVPGERIRLVYNGVDADRFHPDRVRPFREETRAKWGLADECCFLIVAHNFRLKGVFELIEAASILKHRNNKFRVVIVGRKRPGQFEQRARQLGCVEHIHFAGAVTGVEQAYAGADVYVQPTWYDPCSLVALEAWACGLPVITTSFNGAGELMVEGDEGYLISSPRQVEDLARYMEMTMDAERQLHMRKLGRRLAENHTWDRNFAEVMQVLEQAANITQQWAGTAGEGSRAGLPTI